MRFSKMAWIPILLLAIMTISLGAADSAWARGGWGCMNANLTPEQSSQLFDLRQQFMNDTAGLRKQMVVNQTELAALWQNHMPDQKQIQAKQQEINALRDQLQAKRIVFQAKNRQLFPQAGMGRGYGSGHGCNW